MSSAASQGITSWHRVPSASNTVTCTAPTLAPITFGKLSGLGIQIKARATAAVGTTIKNTATVSSASNDSKPGNNTSSVSTKVK